MKHIYWKWDAGSLSSDLCDQWIEKYDSQLQTGMIGGDVYKDGDEKTRRSKVKFVEDADVRDILSGYIHAANRAAFGVDVSNFLEIQFTKYESKDSGFYNWHIDTFLVENEKCFQRKLSVVALLSDPKDFEGGELWIERNSEAPIEMGKGSVIVFPGIVDHMVTPVTAGDRYTMVGWMEGPKWR